MYSRFQNFMVSVIKKLSWGVHVGELSYFEFTETIPGAGEVPVIFSSVDRAEDFYNFVYKVVPYSSQRKSPEIKYSEIMQFLTQWVLPTMQLAQSQGAMLDIPAATKILGDYAGIENLAQFYKTAVPQAPNDKMSYYVMPSQKGQMNDAFGATPGSREGNKQQQQARAGITAKPTPEMK